ncbi:MAG: hypothetical protein II564_05975 [Oscillospiraceae bacterium]|nr:hypothetical protein [Oscillospiraceae bacterium]
MVQYDRLFDAIIKKTNALFEGMTPTVWEYDENDILENSNEVLLLEQDGINIGGSLPGGVNYTVPTGDTSLEIEDQVLLYGPDMSEVKDGAPYGRITFMVLNDEGLSEIQLFNTILDLQNSKHHIHPQGIEESNFQAGKYEVLFISRDVQKKGISFRQLGNSYIAEMKKNPRVLNVKQVFITDPNFDYDEANRVRRQNQTYQIAMRAHSVMPTGFRG